MSIFERIDKENERQNGKRKAPVYIQDETKYDGKSTFCNIEAFPKHGFQDFEKVKGTVHYKP